MKRLVTVDEEVRKSLSIPDMPAIILKGPYEYQIKLTSNYTSCEMMYDLLINGMIYKLIPCKKCAILR